MAKPKKIKSSKDIAEHNDVGLSFSGSHEEGHKIELSRDHALSDVFGTGCNAQSSLLLTQCLKILTRLEAGGDSEAEDARLFIISIIQDMAPRDPIERMLAVQMAATHMATIRAASCLANSESARMRELNGNGLNKLARTFTTQMEALRKHRNGGKQTVTVQHVNVEDGGQAIVGNVAQGGGGKDEK
ncbi:hypothetical protein SAMN05444000_13814 [Shimia gijangensis]|uniref:Uncharacterized protein n=1 Tax=Shimia gijangensis TaxID=1470563 RepID=A0A1M6TEC6_9RHOB|nr:hypothetical protein [Shimia gijangensis]SHK55128.1 hypothetical protein SAMN05444000_13814 [Shimia gijangensis]